MDSNSLDLEEQFKLYLQRAGINPEQISTVQYTETKRAFFGACGQLLILFREVIGEMDEDKAILQMQDLLYQCEIFWKNEMGLRAGL